MATGTAPRSWGVNVPDDPFDSVYVARTPAPLVRDRVPLVRPPTVFVQFARVAWQPPLLAAHSSTSPHVTPSPV